MPGSFPHLCTCPHMANILGGGPAEKGRGKKERILVQANVLVFSKDTSRILRKWGLLIFLAMLLAN